MWPCCSAAAPFTHAQLLEQGRLISEECGLGGVPNRAAQAPVPTVELTSTHGPSRMHLYLVDHLVLVCASDDHGHRSTVEFGRVGTRVRGARFVLSNGTTVPASVGGGWFLIWWSSGRSPTTAKLTTTSGVKTMALGEDAASPQMSCPADQGCFSTSSPGVPLANGTPGAAGVVSGAAVSSSGTALGPSAPGSLQTQIGPSQG